MVASKTWRLNQTIGLTFDIFWEVFGVFQKEPPKEAVSMPKFLLLVAFTNFMAAGGGPGHQFASGP